MEDKITLLTQQLYNEGILKAKNEAQVILDESNTQAKDIIINAQKEADAIVKKAKMEAEELKRNTEVELKTTGSQALKMVRQSIADVITLNVAQQIVDKKLSNKDLAFKLLLHAVENMALQKDTRGIEAFLSGNEKDEFIKYIIDHIHKQFGDKVKINISHKIDSGFRISPASTNYQISFTDDDFIRFFSNLVRPQTASILFGNGKG